MWLRSAAGTGNVGVTLLIRPVRVDPIAGTATEPGRATCSSTWTWGAGLTRESVKPP